MVPADRQEKTDTSNRNALRAHHRRLELWPEEPLERNWSRKGSNGFTTIPRILTLTGTIADHLAEKNKRVSATYWGLWSRVWDTGVVIVENEYELATEAGFSGERRSYTWRDRIKQLVKSGFIAVKKGPKGPYEYVLIYNPYHVLYEHHEKGNIPEEFWVAVVERADEIRANDIESYANSANQRRAENG